MRTEIRIQRILECIHPVFLLPLVVPSFYLFYTQRADIYTLQLYLAGFVLLICSAAAHLAARRVKALWMYLAVCTAAAFLTLFIGMSIGVRLFDYTLRNAFIAELVVGCIWMIFVSAGIRLREKSRRKAKEENDFTWQDTSAMPERPGIFGIVLFCVVYTLALLNNCPVFCDTALTAGLLYLAIVLVYRHASVTERYLKETKDVSNVPVGKIRRIRTAALAAILLLVGMASLPAFLTGRFRRYHDLRFYELKHVISAEDMLFPDEGLPGHITLPEWGIEPGEKHTPPVFLTALEKVLPYIGAAAAAILLWKMMMAYAGAFRGAIEENGDIVRDLQEEQTQKISRSRRGIFSGPLTERERIRKRYRMTIRKYRKRGDLPKRYETPQQIENGTDFPAGYDVQTLHDSYEKARYGTAGP